MSNDITRYAAIVADPPWNEHGGGKIKRGADRHYPLMKTPAVIEYMRGRLLGDETPPDYHLAPNAHLYLWVTNSFLVDGLRVVDALGFRYVTNIAWVKPQIGIGQYFRGQHELCLFAVRGSGLAVRSEARNIPSVLAADYRRDERGRRVHSGKPEAFYELVERRTAGPKLELFARRRRDGWTNDGVELEP